ARPVRGDTAAVRLAHGRRALPRGRGRARRDLPATRVAAPARDDATSREGALPLLAPLPRPALRRDGDRHGSVMDHEFERSNLRFGIGLFVIFLILFGLTVVAAFVYLALD